MDGLLNLPAIGTLTFSAFGLAAIPLLTQWAKSVLKIDNAGPWIALIITILWVILGGVAAQVPDAAPAIVALLNTAMLWMGAIGTYALGKHVKAVT